MSRATDPRPSQWSKRHRLCHASSWRSAVRQATRGGDEGALPSVPGVAAGTALLLTLTLLALAPMDGRVTSAALTADAAPLSVAGGPSPPVFGYVGIGQTRLYVPVPSVLAVLVGEYWVARGSEHGTRSQ